MIEPDERAAHAARQMLLARAMRIGWLGVSIDMARLRLALRQFNPDQPRVPAGQPGGGRWMGEGDTVAPTPAADSPARDVTTDASGATGETTRRSDGSVATQTVLNRDGSAIRSDYGAGNGADARHTVVLPDGTVRQFDNAGAVQTIRDENGNVLSTSRWTADGQVSEPAAKPEASIQQVAAPALLPFAPQIAAGTMAAGAALYTWLSSRAGSDQQTIAAFTARGNERLLGLTAVETMTREDVSNVCLKLEDVQSRLDGITRDVRTDTPGLSPQQFGTEVHTRLKAEIDILGSTDYRGEVSLLKTQEARRYGERGSIRIDVYERASQHMACVYDIKTGQSGLTAARFAEINSRVFETFKGVTNVIVMEVRPFE